MSILDSLYAVHILFNIAFTPLQILKTERGAIQCSSLCLHVFGCGAFIFHKTTLQCTLITYIYPSSNGLTTKIWVRKGHCPILQGYIYLRTDDTEESCIKFHQDLKETWNNARLECFNRNSSLIQLKTNSKTAMIKTYMYMMVSEGLEWWIGLKDVDGNNIYKWFDTSIVVHSDPRWFSSGSWIEPNFKYGDTDNDCVVILPSIQEFGWADYACTEILSYICEIN